jgi:hypothetical protein
LPETLASSAALVTSPLLTAFRLQGAECFAAHGIAVSGLALFFAKRTFYD